MDNNTPERVIMGIKYQGFKIDILVHHRRRDFLYNHFEYPLDPNTGFCRNQKDIISVKTQVFFNLVFNTVNLGRWQINLIDHRNYFKIMLHGNIKIRQGLGFDALAGINQYQGTFAGRKGS